MFGSVSKTPLLALVAVTLLPRLLLLGSEARISIDPLWYLDFGKFMLRGDIPYADFYFPYPPVLGYFILLVMLIGPTIDAFRIIATIFDVAIVFVLYQFSQSNDEIRHVRLLPPVYARFPISIIGSGLNGHFEPIANLFLLLALLFGFKGNSRKGGLFLGLSIATKIYAGILLPLLVFLRPDARKKTEFVITTAVTGILTFIPFSMPVWLRGHLLLPGGAMPSSSSGGFFDSVFDFLFRLDSLRMVTVTLVGLAALLVVGILLARRLRSGVSIKPQSTTFLFSPLR